MISKQALQDIGMKGTKTKLEIELTATGFILWLTQTEVTGAIKKIEILKSKLSKDGSKMDKTDLFINPEIVKLIIKTSLYLEEVEQSFIRQ